MSIKFNTEEFIIRAKNIHNNFYDYSKFEYITAKTKSIIICPTHGEFQMHPNNHLSSKQGCPKCRGNKISSTRISHTPDEELFRRFNETHNGKYIYPSQPQIQRKTNYKIKIICPIHGEFEQSYLNHLYKGNGCEKCGNNRLSKGEQRIEEFLMNNNINHIREYSFNKCVNPETGKKLFFDFYLTKFNTCIEFQGKQHYETSNFFKIRSGDLEKIKIRDQLKKEFCLKNNIDLIIIPYNIFYKISQILSQFI